MQEVTRPMNPWRLRRWIIVGATTAVVTVIVCLLLLTFLSKKEATRDEVKKATLPLVEAVGRFQAAHGRLPKSLDELVPTYVTT